MSRLVLRNVVAGKTRTTIRLEPEIWDAIGDICARENISLSTLIARATNGRRKDRTSAVRVYTLTYYRRLAGRAPAGAA